MVSDCKLIFAQMLTEYGQGNDVSELASQMEQYVLSEDLTWKMNYIDKILRTINGKVSKHEIDIEQAKLDANTLYTKCGFNSFMDFKYLSNLVNLHFNIIEIRYNECEEKVNILKDIFNTNRECPVVEIKNSIDKMCLNALVDSALMPYAGDFAQEVINTVSALSEEDRQTDNVLPGTLRINFGA